MLIKYNSDEYKIYFKHIRKTPFQKKMDRWDVREVVPNDVSICFIENNFTKEIIAQGLSKCSKKDNFVKEVGRQLSLTRAMEKLPFEFFDLPYLICDKYYENKKVVQEVKDFYRNKIQKIPSKNN